MTQTFERLESFSKKATDLPDIPSQTLSPSQIKTYFQTPADELQTSYNKLVDGLNEIVKQPTTELGVQSKLADHDVQLTETVSVKYPPAPLTAAIGDGITDDTAAFTAITGLGKAVRVPKGNYLINSQTASAMWILEPGAVILGLSDVGTEFKIPDTSRLTGRVFHILNKTDAGFRFGDSDPWLERNIRQPSESISEVTVLSPTGQIGLTTGSRSSDNPVSNMATIGLSSYGINDNTTNKEPAWATYFEARRYANAGGAYNSEMDMVNFGSVEDLTPFSAIDTTTGQTVNIWLSSGGGGITGAQNASAAMAIVPNPKQFKRGIVIRQGALDPSINEAIAAEKGASFSWYDSVGKISYIHGEGLQHQKKSDSSGVVYDYYRKRANGITATASLDSLFRSNYYGYSGSGDYLAGYSQFLQRSNFATGNARFSFDVQVQGDAGSQHQISLNGLANASFAPYPDNTISNGTGSFRWSTVYAATSTISTSDENFKQDIAEIGNDLIEAFLAIQPKVFRFKDAVESKGDLARIHMGFIAQELEQELINKGLNPANYAIWCKDEIVDAVKKEDGTFDFVPSGKFMYALRYEHFIALMEAANRKRFDLIENRLKQLEELVK